MQKSGFRLGEDGCCSHSTRIRMPLHVSVGDLELGDVVSVVGDEWSWIVGRRDDLVESVGAAVSETGRFWSYLRNECFFSELFNKIRCYRLQVFLVLQITARRRKNKVFFTLG